MKTESEYIIVHRERPFKTVYLRKRPRDYSGKKELHPNKIRTWIAFGEAAQKNRGKKNFEDHIELMRELTGTTIKEPNTPIAVSERERTELRMQAYNKGLPMSVVDELTVEKEVDWIEVLFPRKGIIK